MPGRMEFEFQFRKDGGKLQKRSDSPMRILIMGDFSGKSGHTLSNKLDNSQPIQSPISIDIDNFENVLQRLGPQVDLVLSDKDKTKLHLKFDHLDDFHPDSLYDNLGLFNALKNTRQRLNDPASFPQAAAELLGEARALPKQNLTRESVGETEKTNEDSSGNLFEDLIGKPASPAENKTTHAQQAEAGLQGFINRLVAPYITPEADPLQPHYLAAVDDAISQQMRSILHTPVFQDLEALWRATWWLVSNVDSGEDLKIFLLDITKDELAADIDRTNGNLELSECYQTIIEHGTDTFAGESWSLLVGNYSFGPNGNDLSLLAALGAIASQAGGPFISQAQATLLGCQNLVKTPNPHEWNIEDNEAAEHWQSLRHSAVAHWIGLILPRILMRLPYGKNHDEIERFAFEEMSSVPNHDNLLWANPALACAQLIVSSFQERGWEMAPDDNTEITDLPAFIYEKEGEKQLQACAELFLTERAAETILGKGIMPIVSYRNRNAARLLRFQSIADPNTALAGPW